MARATPFSPVLITGGDGQLGWELAKSFAPLATVHACTRQTLDLTDADALRERCRTVQPALILNAAAYTAVDRAEGEPELAMRVNGVAPGILAEEANRLDIPLVHFSTDYVFDGCGHRPYREEDPTNPQSVYGRTKLAGERAVAGTARRHLILRTSWLYGNRRQNFLLTMLRLAREREELRVVADQIGSPTWVRPVAAFAAKCVVAEGATLRLAVDPGIYHLAANGQASWHQLATAILDGCPDPARKARRVIPITTAEYPTPAKRPAYSVLAVGKIEGALRLEIPDWQTQLAGCLAERTAEGPRD